jgi:hypothetical protein
MNPFTKTSEPLSTLETPARRAPREPRWPVMLTIAMVILLLEALPRRLTLFPGWVPWAIGCAVLVPIALVALTPLPARWLALERVVTYAFSLTITAVTIANLGNLVSAMVSNERVVGGLQLLASSIGVWTVNVLAFSLLYWQVDRGGPGLRGADGGPQPDWLFPQTGAPAEEAPPGWRPIYVDYLFLAYSTATAFSPTDALPLTTRAKLMMMTESSISLATILVVASRAINILGG